MTTFVIISSDQDFRHHYQLLSGAGYKVIVVHDAKGGTWTQVLEMHADKAFLWRDIMENSGVEVEVESSDSGSRGIRGTNSTSGDRGKDGLGGLGDGDEECPQSAVEESSGRGRGSNRIITSDLGVTHPAIGKGNLEDSGGIATGVGKTVKGILNSSTTSDRLSDDDRPLNINLSRPSTGNGVGTERSHHVHFEDPKVTASKNEFSVGIVGNGTSVDAEIDKTYQAAVTQLSSLKMLVDEKKNKSKAVDSFGQMVTIDAPVGASLGWMEGTCIRWKGTFGFLSVSSSGHSSNSRPSSAMSRSDGFVPKSIPSVHIVAGPIRVYAHYKSLNFIPFAMTLKRGQKVRVLVEMSDRGPCAKKVEAV